MTDARTEAATSNLSGAAGEAALKNAELPENSVSTEPVPGGSEAVVAEGGKPEAVEPIKKGNARKAVGTVKSEPGQAVGGGDVDDVLVSRLRADGKRKSLSVYHLQRRLWELGYVEAAADTSGRFGDLTGRSVAAWQKDHGHDDGDLDIEQATELFKGDPNVRVLP